MELACIRHTDLPATSRLFADFTYHFDRVARLYRHDPHDFHSLTAAAREIDYRTRVVTVLRERCDIEAGRVIDRAVVLNDSHDPEAG